MDKRIKDDILQSKKEIIRINDEIFEDNSKVSGHFVLSVDPAGFEKAHRERGLKSYKLD